MILVALISGLLGLLVGLLVGLVFGMNAIPDTVHMEQP